jgi:uncharacterized protein YjbI with pentapeptide repeats/5-hydroxyisourate hydrolase-like protein (transthyretin family)
MVRRVVSAALIAGAVAVASLLAAGCQTPGAVLKGRLTVAAGGTHPAGVSVAVYSNTTDTVVAQTTTDGQGDYSFVSSTLPDGTYRVLFSTSDWWSHAGDWADATPMVVAAATPVTLDETLTPATGSVAGTVTDLATNPIAGVSVAAVDPTDTTVASTTTAADGTYDFASLPAGPYVIEFTAPGYGTRYNDSTDTRAAAPTVTVGDGSTSTGIDTTLAPQAGITGVVTNGRLPLAGIAVVAYDASGSIASGVTTGSDGTFHLGTLDAASYTLELGDPTGAMRTEVWGSTSTDPTTGTPVTPPVGGTTSVGTIGLVGHDCHLDASPYGPTLTNANLTNCNLAGTDFAGANLSGANLSGANLSGADLEQVKLTGADLDGAKLTNANLTDVISGGVTGTPVALPTGWILTQGYLVGPSANLVGANLAGVDLQHIDLQYADFENADLLGADVSGDNLTFASLRNTNLSQAYVINTDLTESDLTGTNFTEASLDGAILTNTAPSHDHFNGADLTNANLAYISIDSADFSFANLSGANLSGATLTEPTLAWTNLSGATLTGAALVDADLSSATLTNVTSGSIRGSQITLPTGWTLTDGYLVGPGADLTNADFTGANLTNANLTNANLTNANLTNTNLTNAVLPNATFTGANLSGTNLTGATLDAATSGGIIGSPASLPGGWTLANGYLLGFRANLAGADLANLNLGFLGLSLQNANLTGADLSHTIVGPQGGNPGTGTVLTDANLTGADLEFTQFGTSNMDGATLTNAELDHAQFLDTTLDGVTSGGIFLGVPALPQSWELSQGYLIGPGANLSGASLRNFSFAGLGTGLNLGDMNLTGADLTGATFAGAFGSPVTFTNAKFNGAKLDDANLTGVSLFDVDLTGADLTGATLTRVTSFGLVGTPAALPAGWTIVSGTLVGPG